MVMFSAGIRPLILSPKLIQVTSFSSVEIEYAVALPAASTRNATAFHSVQSTSPTFGLGADVCTNTEMVVVSTPSCGIEKDCPDVPLDCPMAVYVSVSP